MPLPLFISGTSHEKNPLGESVGARRKVSHTESNHPWRNPADFQIGSKSHCFMHWASVACSAAFGAIELISLIFLR